MFTKGQTAYSIALLSYKDDETEKIITHTISKVGRSFVYDEKETKYHYSNKYKAFISADAFHHQQAIFPTEKTVQEYLERRIFRKMHQRDYSGRGAIVYECLLYDRTEYEI